MAMPSDTGVLFLHALPLDGSMWAAHLDLSPISSYAPTLYGLGDTIEAWADEVLKIPKEDKLIVVGCSVGGSCAVEVAFAAPERVSALVLVGTKARHDPNPGLHRSALKRLENEGIDGAWKQYWAPLFSKFTDQQVIEEARNAALRQETHDIARGITAFHTRRSRDQFVSRFEKPVVVVTGEDDVAPGWRRSAELATSTVNGRLRVIPSCGHYVPLEQPAILRTILEETIESNA